MTLEKGNEFMPHAAAVLLAAMSLSTLFLAPLLIPTTDPRDPSPSQPRRVEHHLHSVAEVTQEARHALPRPRRPHPPSLPGAIPTHALPLECRGLEVLRAEEIEYEGGWREIRCVLEGFLGQENVLVSAFLDTSGYPLATTVSSAERLTVFAPEYEVPMVRSALASMGFAVTREKYGARTLQVGIPRGADFLAALDTISSALAGRADVLFCPTSPCGVL